MGRRTCYHETITTAWVRLLATHREDSFAEFLRGNEAQLSIGLLHLFWTPEILAGQEARTRWLAPDRRELPSR